MSGFDDLDLELGPVQARPAAGGPVVLIRREALDAVLSHGAQDLDTELGGVLLGHAASSAEGTLVLVEAAIPALYTQAARAHVTFTHDTWEQVNATRDRDYPDLRIVGWYHTHPGFGLFLSEHDLFIQREFFREPWQVAQVIDPRTGQWGFFVWEGGGVKGPRDAQIVGAAPAGPPQPAPRPIPQPAPPVAAPKLVVRPAVSWLQWATLVCAILAAGWLARPATQPPAQQSGTARGQRLAAIEAKIDALDRKVTELSLAAAESRSAASAAASSAAAEEEQAEEYTVRRGDSLWRIAQVKYGNGAKWRIIARFNDITSPELEPGMRLMIPHAPQDGGVAP